MGIRAKHLSSRAVGKAAPETERPDQELAGTQEQEPKDKKKAYDPQKDTYEWLHCIVVAIIVCVLLFVLAVRVIDVRGQSMEPTLHEGDKLIPPGGGL